jgi:hypothetical protein
MMAFRPNIAMIPCAPYAPTRVVIRTEPMSVTAKNSRRIPAAVLFDQRSREIRFNPPLPVVERRCTSAPKLCVDNLRGRGRWTRKKSRRARDLSNVLGPKSARDLSQKI